MNETATESACYCIFQMSANGSGPGDVTLHPECPTHGVTAQPELWEKTARVPDGIIVFRPDVEAEVLQEILDLATRNWPAWQCLVVAAQDAGVWMREPTKVIAGPELLDHLRQLDLDTGPHRDAALLAKIGAADSMAIYDDNNGAPMVSVGDAYVSVTTEEAARLAELGALDGR